MKLSDELQQRGFVHQFTAETVEEIFNGQKRVVYHGIDPTADSAHAGNMVVWMLLRHLARDGHTIIFLVGGGTGMIGDPKPDAERTLQSQEDIDAFVTKIQAQAQHLIGSDDSKVIFVNNKDWLTRVNLIPFLRDIGKHFTVNELIKKEAIAKRLESDTGLSYTEFAYPLLQGYDYLELHKQYNCDLQVGGSDQWGNIVSGVDLIRRTQQQTVYALTVPLVVDKATGKKFGKSEGNAVWLDPEKTAPFAFFQFWLNTSDESVIDYLKLFTFIDLEEIEQIKQTFYADPGSRSAQQRLAYEVTAFVHSPEVAHAVQRVSQSLFGEIPLRELSPDEIDILREHAPLCTLPDSTSILDVLLQSELASSKREARTFVESGAVSINGQKVESIDLVIKKEMFDDLLLLKRGKKKVSLIALT